MWLACYTQEEIAEAVGLNTTDKSLRVSGNSAELPKNQKAAADHLTDFDVPLYNVWKFKKRTPDATHFGMGAEPASGAQCPSQPFGLPKRSRGLKMGLSGKKRLLRLPGRGNQTYCCANVIQGQRRWVQG